MTQERFQELFTDENVHKVGTVGMGFFYDNEKDYAFFPLFNHTGISDSSNYSSTPPRRRFIINVFPYETIIPEVNLNLVTYPVYFLANADIAEYALLYAIKRLEDQKGFFFQVIEESELGSHWTSDEERAGILVPFVKRVKIN